MVFVAEAVGGMVFKYHRALVKAAMILALC